MKQATRLLEGTRSPVHDEPIHIDQNESENCDAEFQLTLTTLSHECR